MNFVAPDDSTIFISGPVSITSSNGSPALILEGGSCLKFTNSSMAGLTVNGSILCKTGSYRTAILTSWSDDSCGTAIAGSTGVPTNFPSGTYIDASSSNSFQCLRVSYAGTGIQVD